ncbi:MAG: SUF system Fe-S cluster assembly regulator [Alphaproteobacteria bacterium]|jgi:FeS assembly SUF system regulator|nr:SUF system Fe-S cluster assembly regulator [Alphaproteobacteria bacterium]MDP6813640.1 SUF system Fe-S cluster assembly regulator [Alphaproteobacteria bacterium]
MIRLNKMTDYAVVMLTRMATEAGVVTASQMAQDSGVPQPTVSKLLKLLGRAGILSSQRGAGGGYVLSRPAEAISVAEIITALEGPISLTACIDGADTSCGSMPLCPMSGNWNRVNQAIQGALDGVSLADMMPRPLEFENNVNLPAQPADNETETIRQ